MKSRIIVLLDEPLNGCNKLWLLRGLNEAGLEVKVIPMPVQIFSLEQSSKIGKLMARILVILQASIAIMYSKRKDVIFCWNHWTGIYVNLLGHVFAKRIISYNWLTPSNNRLTRWMLNFALKNKRLWAITNSNQNKELLERKFNLKKQNNIVFIPDVYDNLCDMVHDNVSPNDRYVFMGGASNRDWDMFLDVAREFDSVKFIGVASKIEWNESIVIPDNVIMKFDIKDSDYYSIMEKSYLVLVLLKEEKVAGLINILKAVQLGKLVISSRIDATDQYFPVEQKKYLVGRGNKEELVGKIKAIFRYSADEYNENLEMMQKYILDNFSPKNAMVKIREIINTIVDNRS